MLLKRSFLPFLFLLVQFSYAQVEHNPYPVHDTKSVITQLPYLMDPSETGMTISWMVDTPGHAKVVYGKAGEELNQTASAQKFGMKPVGTHQSVRLKNLEPGTTYRYKVMTRRVVELNPYWPAMGEWVESEEYEFTTFDKKKEKINFSVITDTHENVSWINGLMDLVDWDKTDFFAHVGDAFDYLESEKQLFKNWLTPVSDKLKHKKPLVYARGNHELRGPFARDLFPYVPIEEDKFYFARDHGPAHFIVMDSGEDKADSTNVYAGLNALKEYKEEEFKWLENHLSEDKSAQEAPFRIVLMHDSRWGWDELGDKWNEIANEGDVDFMISGHWHRFKRMEAGESGTDFPVLVLGQR